MLENFFSINGPYARFMNWLWNMLVISILWLLCCIPIVTIGAASTAAYYAAAKSVRHHTGKVAAEFFASFRANLIQAGILTVIFALITAVLLVECLYLYSDASVPVLLVYLFYLMIVTVAGCMLYLWPCLSRFAKGNFALIRMAVIITFRHLPTTILLLLLLCVTALGIYLMPWGILLFPGMMIYLQTFLMEKILLRYSPKPVDEAEANKWYYQ